MEKQMQILDPMVVRRDFPILTQKVNNRPLVYFDNAATTQKPRSVIKALVDYYEGYNSNVHRGVHFLSQKATTGFEGARETIRQFINAKYTHEVIYTRGTTEAINLVASTWGRQNIKAGEEILISELEHHSNIVPWQLLCEEKKAILKVIPVFEDGTLNIDAFRMLLNEKTRLLAITHISNSLGTIIPLKKLIEMAHANNTMVLVDGAQALSHLKVDVQDLDCDFYAFSAHKVYGPMGIGGLYGKENILDSMPPYQGGGEMIKTVTFEKTIYNELPFKFEAGTPNAGGAIAFAAALDYVSALGISTIATYENDLRAYATNRLLEKGNIRIIGTSPNKAAVISFVIDKIHPYDAGTILDQMGIAVRTGNHCTQPLMDKFGLLGTIRASMAFYNTKDEVDLLIDGINKVESLFL
ncbi:MAG TPA: cysteine desulfurase [Lentimicrobium sp.]|nr:cysteine desulfurase [Lentimicrobium sp.]